MDLASSRSALQSLARRQATMAPPPALLNTFCGTTTEPAVERDAIVSALVALTSSPDMDWAPCAVGLVCLEECLARHLVMASEATPLVLANLEHAEHRVRNTCARVVRRLATANGPQTWIDFGPTLLRLVRESLALQMEERGIEAERLGQADTCSLPAVEDETSIGGCLLPMELVVKRTKAFSVVECAPPVERLRANSSNASARYRADSGAVVLMVHETMGWKALESSLNALNELVQGFGSAFRAPHELVDVLADQLLVHENRFTRELGFELCASLGATALDPASVNRLLALAAAGLADAWNQVRLSAIKTVRAMLAPRLARVAPEVLDAVLPALAFNRHNVADGAATISTAATPDGARLTVSNTGAVVPLVEVERLFQPFQRLGDQRVAPADGHGLGLAIVKAIATAHGANLTARPGPRGGLDVQVTFRASA